MVNFSETVHDESFASNNASLINRLENSVFNRSNFDYLKTCINFFEKKSVNYTVVALPCSGDERKATKRPKRVNNHNMYILFNSFYTKIRKPEWPNSPTMWDTVKAQKELADFVLVFDHTQKLGKNITNRSASSSSTETTNKRRRSVVTNVAEVQENCDQRDKLYSEFYSVLNETFKNGVAPASSSIYDNIITRELVTKNMEMFKNIALKLPSANYVPTPVSKKRRAPPVAPKKVAVKQRRDTKPLPTYVSDNTQDTNMSE
ncbi:39K [Choristoneura rosaceana nucleopolyhedrovirus]|uniref:39K n=1 Tax=Choristoneura rosaceana nucleopolyhedrovirus TaxID=58094 RepID=S5N454_9ABAC|nr:39K [Choristoneura rosaceana nucleopolyhedrovirus]AGR57165.1 39K [Choristoneura rosaceana nucleopolyhedrovirus]